MSSCKCPHCGWEYDAAAERAKLGREAFSPWAYVPLHFYPVAKPARAICPGSQQYPRNEHDHRPLWKDGGVTKPFGE